MQNRIIIIIWVLFLTGILKAQTDFRPGYILKAGNDTLFGEIDYRGDEVLGKYCRFKAAERETQTDYSPAEISGYRFNKGRYFVSKEINNIKVFLEVLVKGKITFYYLRDDKGDRYFIEKNSTDFSELSYYEQINMIDGREYLYKSTLHRNILNFYLQDAPKLKSKIDKMGKPNHHNLLELGEEYNSLFKNTDDGTGYKKKLPPQKLEIEISGGLINLQDLNGITDITRFMPGILAYIWLPLTNEKLYFRTGVQYSDLVANNKKGYFYRIPFQIEYRYPKGFIRPILGAGLNIYYSPAILTIAFRGGVNLRLNSMVSLVISYDIDFNPRRQFPIFPENLATQSVATGLQIHF